MSSPEGASTVRERRTPHQKGVTAKRRVRCAKALELRLSGGSYSQIGNALGVSEKTAYYDVQIELAKLDQAKEASAERLRDVESMRCDKLTLALAQRVSTGDPKAVVAMVRVMERRARLWGLDSPAKIEVARADRPLASMTAEELEAEIEAATAALRGTK